MSYTRLREQFAAELAQMQALLAETTSSSLPQINTLTRYYLQAPGKHIRPLLILLPAKRKRPALKLAAAVELLHMASLVHDDVIDEAPLRHGQPSINRHYGNRTAVLLGDHFFAGALRLAASVSRLAVQQVSEVITQLVAGEFAQMNPLVSESDYYARIGKKTAQFFATCAYLGGVMGELAPQLCLKLKDYGYNLGLAYQIQDDLLDWQETPQVSGKASGLDLSHGILTLPVIHALKHSQDHDQLALLLQEQNPDPEKIRPYLEAAGSIAYARQQIHTYLVAVRAALAGLEPTLAAQLRAFAQSLFSALDN